MKRVDFDNLVGSIREAGRIKRGETKPSRVIEHCSADAAMENPWSPELETLDQLLGGDLPLPVIRGLYDDPDRFKRGVTGLLNAGEICLLNDDGTEVPRWRWRGLLGSPMDGIAQTQVSITQAGARRIG